MTDGISIDGYTIESDSSTQFVIVAGIALL
jgi:hypothetical protein